MQETNSLCAAVVLLTGSDASQLKSGHAWARHVSEVPLPHLVPVASLSQRCCGVAGNFEMGDAYRTYGSPPSSQPLAELH